MLPASKDIKKAQKESLLFRELSTIFWQITQDEPRLSSLIINRVKLSPDKGCCTVYFYTAQGQESFDQLLEILKLYKPSIRTALSKLKSRYTPEIIFRFDTEFEKIERLEHLINSLKDKQD